MARYPFAPATDGGEPIGGATRQFSNGYFQDITISSTAEIEDTNINTADITTENVTTSNITTANVGTLNMSGAINETSATLASAATLEIGATAANTIIVTGTTAITAFDTVTAGITRKLKFSATLTLTYSASILLPTGANIITVAGDTALFVSEGSGVWRCHQYQRYDGTALTSSNPIAIINETQTSGTNGGTFTSGDWRTRTLNTTVINQLGLTLSSNQITLPAGTYKLTAKAPAYMVDAHKSRLQNVTDNTTVSIGSNERSSSTDTTGTSSFIFTIFNINTSKTFEIQHYCSTTESSNGFGATNTISGSSEIYTQVIIEKVG